MLKSVRSSDGFLSKMDIQVRKPRVYERLCEDIRRQIRSGVLLPENYLLPEYELAKKYQMSSRAVRQGLARLEEEGLIRRYQGRGTIVLAAEKSASQTRKPRNVAIIFQGRVRDAATAEELDGFQQSFQAEGYGTTLFVADGSAEKESEIVEQLASEGVPGLVLYSTHPSNSDAHLRSALDAGMKIVCFDHDFPQLPCSFVGIDDHLAAFEATEHLARLGCRELLLINAERHWTTTELRQSGFEDAVVKWGVPRRILRLSAGSTISESLREGLLPLLGAAQRPLGILVWCDAVAYRAIQCLRQAKWSVPADVRVIGIGNDFIGGEADVPLTTMERPRQEITRLAATALVNQMRDPSRPPQRIRVKARMIIRESCGNYRRPREVAPTEMELVAATAET
jgi:DNA-binding LacI/PurR family transcriptional regulator